MLKFIICYFCDMKYNLKVCYINFCMGIYLYIVLLFEKYYVLFLDFYVKMWLKFGVIRMEKKKMLIKM